MNEENNPMLKIYCGNCRRSSDSPKGSYFDMWCNKKQERVNAFNYCNSWMPSKDDVINCIFRFNNAKNKGE